MPRVELKVTKNQEVMKVIGKYDGKTLEVTKLIYLSVDDSKLTEKWVNIPKERWSRNIDYFRDEIIKELGKVYYLRNEILVK